MVVGIHILVYHVLNCFTLQINGWNMILLDVMLFICACCSPQTDEYFSTTLLNKKEGEKIDVKNMGIVESDIPSRLYRTIISRETKMDTYNFLKTSLSNAIELIYYYLSEGTKNSKKEYSFGSGIVEKYNDSELSTSPPSKDYSSKDYSSNKNYLSTSPHSKDLSPKDYLSNKKLSSKDYSSPKDDKEDEILPVEVKKTIQE